MAMSKQDYIALADALIRTKPVDVTATERITQWGKDVIAIADFCSSRPAFNRERWIAYITGKCGPNGGKRG